MARKKKDEKEVKTTKKSTKTVKKNKKENNGISKINRFNILFVDLQVIFTVLTVIVLIWYLFDKSAWHFLQIILGITMIIIGYNNKIIYNRPKFAWVYYITGAVLIIFDILLLLGV
jgi:hypothetical protein